MTPQQIEAMKLALEALEDALNKPMWDRPKITEAITAIEEALAQPEQEPVIDKSAAIRIATSLGWTPQRKPLTDEQIIANDVLRYHFALNGGAGPISKKGRKVIDAIEAAHGIKENT